MNETLTEILRPQLKLIELAWRGYPVKLHFREQPKRSKQRPVPTWQACQRDELHVMVRRGTKYDAVVVVKHQWELECSLSCRAEALNWKEWNMLGVLPQHKTHICLQCQQFATRINIDERCQTCHTRDKESSKP